ncbi:hypothetical protein ACLOJK_022419 [Asimina triloba]
MLSSLSAFSSNRSDADPHHCAHLSLSLFVEQMRCSTEGSLVAILPALLPDPTDAQWQYEEAVEEINEIFPTFHKHGRERKSFPLSGAPSPALALQLLSRLL